MNEKPNLPVLAEGKTKIIFDRGDGTVLVWSKSSITGGDGKRKDDIEGKELLSNETTCNVFRLLKACGINLAFIEQFDGRSFIAHKAIMLCLEIIARRQAYGSSLERAPYLQKGHVFHKLVFERFLKTTGKMWGGVELVCDDPMLRVDSDGFSLFDPHRPIAGQEPFRRLARHDGGLASCPFWVFDEQLESNPLKRDTLLIFLILEKAWQLAGGRLVDFKIEFGALPNGSVGLADVLDAESCRVLIGDQHIDKQPFREGASITKVKEGFEMARTLSSRFALPRQRAIIWRASKSDDVGTLIEAFGKYRGFDVVVEDGSAHKETVSVLHRVRNMVQECPDSVVIAEVGRSNGLGPVLASNLPVPVITRPATWKERPEDIWSSLRGPGRCPVLTVLESDNAVLAALRILALRNPWLYAQIQLEQEQLLTNFVPI